jgi:hypothetical protein
MGAVDDPFEMQPSEGGPDLFEGLTRRPVGQQAGSSALTGVVTARFHGFALDDSPVIAALPQLPGELVPARTVVGLRRDEVGASVVVVFEGGDVRRPIVLGVLQDSLPRRPAEEVRGVTVHADDERYEIKAEREIVLRCGDASITLTRAGKVLIKGNYVLTRSTGANRIKGAVVDIN